MEFSFLNCFLDIKTDWGNCNMLQDQEFDFATFLNSTPEVPGIYRFFDHQSRVIYVGKAVNLRNRLRSYFQKTSHRPDMNGQIFIAYTIFLPDDISTYELEYGIYQKYYLPYFNKTTPEKTKFLTFTTIPIITLDNALKHRDDLISLGQMHFGPFLESRMEVNKLLMALQLCFRLPDCTNHKFRRNNPCDTYHNQRCDAPCHFEISDYDLRIASLTEIMLKGKKSKAYRELTQEQKNILGHYVDYLPATSRVDFKDLSLNCDVVSFTIVESSLIISVFEIHNGMILDIRNLKFRGDIKEILLDGQISDLFAMQLISRLYIEVRDQRKQSHKFKFESNKLFLLGTNLESKLVKAELVNAGITKVLVKTKLPSLLKSITDLINYNAFHSANQFNKLKK